MSKKEKAGLASARKWLEKNAEIGATVKPAITSIDAAEKAVSDVAALRIQLAKAISSRDQAVSAFKTALKNVKLEKKLKAKELRVKTKLANLTGTPN